MIEICCGSYQDAYNAYLGGAKRVELNSALYLGGLTPTVGALRLTKQNTDLKVICMVRPRGAGFCYNDADFAQVLADAQDMLDNGADGLAFGFLTADHQIDVAKTKQVVTLVKNAGKEAVFHRAFDCVKDPYQAIELLISLGINRILTSGLQAKAFDGRDLIKDLQEKYGDKIELLAGSGVNAQNAMQLVEYTNIKQVHSSCKTWENDPTTSGVAVNYCFSSAPNQDDYDTVSVKLVEELTKLGI